MNEEDRKKAKRYTIYAIELYLNMNQHAMDPELYAIMDAYKDELAKEVYSK